jgi:hypothetical protein
MGTISDSHFKPFNKDDTFGISITVFVYRNYHGDSNHNHLQTAWTHLLALKNKKSGSNYDGL